MFNEAKNSTSAEVHAYTSLLGEKNDSISDGWTNEGLAAYVNPIKLPGYIALYRYRVFESITILSTNPTSLFPMWSHTGIMNATTPTTIDPLLNTSKEQAIVLIGPTFNTFYAP